MIAPGRFDNDSVLFPPASGFVLEKGRQHAVYLRESRLLKKIDYIVLSGSFINLSPSKHEIYSSSGPCSFNLYNFKIVEQ